jgi:hypothetical protein
MACPPSSTAGRRRLLRLACLLVLAASGGTRGDDAFVLPAGAWRVYAVPAWSSVSSTWDGEGVRHEIPEGAGRIKAFNLGLALEYGINCWITAGFQWTPGPNLSSSFDFPPSDPAGRDRARLDDSFDALLGVKFAIVASPGPSSFRSEGLVRSDRFRLALGTGVRFPLSSVDWEREARRYAAGDTYLPQAVDKHLVAPILGLYADWVVARSKRSELFVGFYSQYVPYLSTANWAETSLARYLDPALAGVRVDYRYDAYVEVEPRYDHWAVPGKVRVGLHVPVRDRIFPAPLLNGVDQHNSGYRVIVTPTLDLMLPLPGVVMELKAGWQRTVAGKNAASADAVVLVLRALI